MHLLDTQERLHDTQSLPYLVWDKLKIDNGNNLKKVMEFELNVSNLAQSEI